ncbi:MAG: tRNA (adenosine(37)-N6)-dimethylallyltransferase MiaA [Gemmatimonadota bacterium]|nr:tRNA (adenosine(37)-N6)-dimethylallyltransferase MiaA [Gemmatimonadota bacterium]
MTQPADGLRPRFLAVVGPTASGKTELSTALADRLDLEVVSVDSRQVYRGMDIGTDKVAPDVRAAIPHHGLDLVDPSERYSAGRFAREARHWIEAIEARGRLPVLVGGTGFFLKALIDPIFDEPDLDPARRTRLRAFLREQASERLESWVRILDPDRAPVAVEGGTQRMTRTLEVALLTGRPLSWWHRSAPREGDPVEGVIVVPHVPRPELDRRIDARVARMLERGLVEEVRGLLEAGYTADDPGMSATGYREIVAYLNGEMTLDEAGEAIRAATRRFARRQMTWFRHQLPAHAVEVDGTAPLAERVDYVLSAWRDARERGSTAGGTA